MLVPYSQPNDRNDSPIRMSKNHLINEHEIIAASKKDPNHFRPVYEYYYRPILNYIYHRTNEINDAAEIASSVFYKALTNLHKYQDKNIPFGAWLYKIAYNETMQYFRKSKKTRHVVMDDALIESIAEEVEVNDKPRLLQAAMMAFDNLAPQEVEIMDLKYFQQKPNREIAFIVGMSEGALKVKAHRIIQKIKKIIAERYGQL